MQAGVAIYDSRRVPVRVFVLDQKVKYSDEHLPLPAHFLQEALGKLFRAVVMFFAGAGQDVLHMCSEFGLTPLVARGEFRAARISFVGAFDQSPGCRLVE